MSVTLLNDLTITEIKEIVFNLLDFDLDWNGENGDDYLLDEAEDLGYESNNEWLIDTFIKENDYNSIISALEEFLSRNDGHYIGEVEIEDIEHNNEVLKVLSFSCYSVAKY